MNHQLAVLTKQVRSDVFGSHARSTRHHNDVRIVVERLQDRLAIVRDQRWKNDGGAVTLGKRPEHRPICVGDAVAMGRRPSWQNFVARHDQADAWPANDTHLTDADRAQQAHILWPQPPSLMEHGCTGHDVLSTNPDMLSRRHCGKRVDAQIALGE